MARRRFLLLLALWSASSATSAQAYTVLSPGEILRMDALILWDAGEEVLLLSPVVRGGGVLVMPLPPGARLLPAPPEAARWLGALQTHDAQETPEGSGPPGSLPADPELDASLTPTARRPKALLPRGAPPTSALIARATPPPEPATKILLVPADRLGAALGAMGLPASRAGAITLATDDLASTMAARVLLVALPRDPEAVRVAPLALTFDAVWPRLPLLRAPTPRPHPLTLRLFVAGAVRDLGGMDFVFGLRRGKTPAADTRAPSPSLLAFVERALGRAPSGLRRTDLVAGAFAASKAVAAGLHDLRLPPPLGSRVTPRRRSGHPREARPAAPREGPVAPPGDAPQGEGCGACSLVASPLGARRQEGGAALALLLLVMLRARARRGVL